MLKNLIARLIGNPSPKLRGLREIAPSVVDDRPDTSMARTFTIHEALNGQFIRFNRYKYNHGKSDEYESCVYIVKDGETLVDAISTVLVLMQRSTDGA